MYKILDRVDYSDDVYMQVIEAPAVAAACKPGQFIILRIDEEGERIPLTIADFDRVAGTITIVVQATRMSDGTRKVTSICEITGMEENVISMQEIFSFNKKGIGPDGRVLGAFQPTRIRPRFVEQLRISGIVLPASLFEREMQVS